MTTVYKINPQGCCNTATYVQAINAEQHSALDAYCLDQQDSNPNGSYGVTADKVQPINVFDFDEWQIFMGWGRS